AISFFLVCSDIYFGFDMIKIGEFEVRGQGFYYFTAKTLTVILKQENQQAGQGNVLLSKIT
ncbi:MAG TPA: hypothetical protein VKY57_01830, partial [Chitinispirillaceae bacterium]|nr:hypothetical protein [Chitinispirillaceae bacterium]